MITNLTSTHWNHIVEALEVYIDSETARLSTFNASDLDWRKVYDLQSTLNDIVYYVIPLQ